MNHTIIVVSDNETKFTTINKRWIKKLERLVSEDHAEELEPEDHEVGRVFVGGSKLLQLPAYRAGREYSNEDRAKARERMLAMHAGKTKTKAKSKKK